MDEMLMDHFRAQLRSKFGEDQASGAKFEHRLRRHCEKLKKLLSTIDNGKVDADSLLPDHDCSLVLQRPEFEALAKPCLDALAEVILSVLREASSPDPSAISSVEVVGGGARVPCVLDTIRKVSGHAQTKHTLDSSAAVSFGAASLAKLLAPQAGEAVEGAAPAPRIEGGAFVNMLSSAGMSDDEVAAAVEREGGMRETDGLQREAQNARNSLEGWVYSIRNALDGRSGSLLDREFTEKLLDEVEEWLGGEGFAAQEYRAKHEEAVASLKGKSAGYFEKEEELRKEAEAKEEEEEARRRKEEDDNRSTEDHDNRILKFAERYAMADRQKAEGNELFKDGNCKFAAERYIKALGHLAKLVHVESTMKEEEHEQAKVLKLTCLNNLAQCFLKLEMWSKAADNCSAALDLDPANAKALFRRAQARMETKDYEAAVADLKACLAVNADDKAVAKLLEKGEKAIKAAEAKQKKVFSKMFG